MDCSYHTQRLPQTEEALSGLFCVVDDAHALLHSRARCYESLKRHLSDLRQSEKHAAMRDPYRRAAGLVRSLITELNGRAGYSGFSLQIDTSAPKQGWSAYCNRTATGPEESRTEQENRSARIGENPVNKRYLATGQDSIETVGAHS